MVQKYQHQQKYVVLVNCAEDVVRRKEHSFGNRGTRNGLTEQITGEILRRSEEQKRPRS